MAALLSASDVFVFPSRPVGEGMPGVLIEAGLSGLPVVATDVPGVRSVVEDGETGIVVDVEDTGAMVQAVAGLVVDTGRRATMGAAARQRCLDRFSLGAVAERWMGVLAPLLPPDARRPTGGDAER